ncbi:MAG: hypothetical protein DI538_29430 [Azospira oryzae]|nr:MAG: hypothetical protein DI538_29430 [Azospira oryzae]
MHEVSRIDHSVSSPTITNGFLFPDAQVIDTPVHVFQTMHQQHRNDQFDPGECTGTGGLVKVLGEMVGIEHTIIHE